MTLSVDVLGTRSPYPVAESPCSGYLVNASDTFVLLDLGLAVWPELLRQIDPSRLSAIWISHLHPDHSADLLAAYQWAANTDGLRPIPVYGPTGWAERLGAFLPIPDGAAQVRRLFDVHEHTGDPALFGDLTATAVSVHHSVPTWGFRLTCKAVSMAYSADTGPCAALDTLADDADMLICEAGSVDSGTEYHCSPEEAAHAGLRARRLVLTHLAPGLAPPDASHRAGGAEIAEPGMHLDIRS
jgi:ribonuclease BN (tRNA processing enzyme)